MYGIPNMKLDKRIVQRRVDLMAAEGVKFVTGTMVGPAEEVSLASLRSSNDAVVISTGAQVARGPQDHQPRDGGHSLCDGISAC